MDVLHELSRTVLRSFYDDKSVIFFEFILQEKILSDEELADRMRIVLKEVNRTAARLREDKLLKCESRQETRLSDQKMINKTYYYIDYKLFVDSVKYKMFMMKKSLEDKMRSELENKGYKCPVCAKSYAALELQSLINPKTMEFQCEVCNAEIEEHAEDPAKLKATQDTLSQLMEQTAHLVRLLKKTDTISIPYFDPVEFLKQKQAFAALEAQREFDEADGDSNMERSNPSTTSVNIQIQIDETESKGSATNSLPSWYTHSTVTGEKIVADGENEKKFTDNEVNISSTTVNTVDTTDSIAQYYEDLQSSVPLKRVPEEDVDANHEIQEETQIMITVAGISKPLDQVTDEDKSNMTAEEYAQYYEAYMSSM